MSRVNRIQMDAERLCYGARATWSSRPMGRAEERGWLWLIRRWHWFSLDAVTVLVAYAWGLARLSGAEPPGRVFVFLGVGVWLGYSADRLADVQRDPARADQSPRHAFHLRHVRRFRALWWTTCGSLIVAGAWILPLGAFCAGAFVALGAAAYVRVFAARNRSPRLRSVFAKRLATVSLLAWAGGWWWPWWPGLDGRVLAVGVLLFVFTAGWELILLHHLTPKPMEEKAGRRLKGAGVCCQRSQNIAVGIVLSLSFLAGGWWALPGGLVLAASIVGLSRRWSSGIDSSLRAAMGDALLALGWLLLGGFAG